MPARLPRVLSTALALGLVAPCTFAQSQVSIYGVIDEYVGTLRSANASSPPSTTGIVNSGGMTTSFIGFRGREDLGGGLKALFNVESFLRADTGVTGRNDTDAFWGRLSVVGLSSDRWGMLTIGRHVTPYAIALGDFSPLTGSTTFSPSFVTVFKGNVLGDTRMNNSIRYVTPSMNGFVVDTLYSFGTETSNGPNAHQARAFDGSIRYEQKNWRVIAATRQLNLNADDNGHKQKSYMVAASYDFGFTKLNLQVHDSHETYEHDSRLEVKRRAYELSAGVPVGQLGKFVAAYAYANANDRVPSTPDSRRVLSLSYDYTLSKRTDVYAVAFRDLQRNPLIEQRIFAVGVRHRF